MALATLSGAQAAREHERLSANAHALDLRGDLRPRERGARSAERRRRRRRRAAGRRRAASASTRRRRQRSADDAAHRPNLSVEKSRRMAAMRSRFDVPCNCTTSSCSQSARARDLVGRLVGEHADASRGEARHAGQHLHRATQRQHARPAGEDHADVVRAPSSAANSASSARVSPQNLISARHGRSARTPRKCATAAVGSPAAETAEPTSTASAPQTRDALHVGAAAHAALRDRDDRRRHEAEQPLRGRRIDRRASRGSGC